MDGSMNFSGLDQSLEHGIETPGGIGLDERRMHVRAYNYWVSLLDGRAYPSIEDLDPENLQDFGPNSVLLDFTGGIDNPAISFLGHALRRECSLDPDTTHVADIPTRSLLSRLTDHYMQIIANRAPIGFEAEFVNERGNNTMYRGILMPFSSDDDTIDFIYGVINWKEVATAETVHSIADELERVLQSNPLQRKPVAAAAWADGPTAAPIVRVQRAPAPLPFDMDLGDEDEASDAILELAESDVLDAPDAFIPNGSESLADWLAAARASAALVLESETRTRAALYRALDRAYDFALIADSAPEDYAELLADSGISVQARAPMTPIVKLVFGISHDKTRLAEYALALTHARRIGIEAGGFEAFITPYPGGLKGVINAERAERRPTPRARPAASANLDRVRALPPIGVVSLAGDEEFVMLIARRLDGDHVAIVGQAGHDRALLDRLVDRLDR